jgi:hypothetical protein
VTLREIVRTKLVGAGTDPWGEDVLELEGARTDGDLASPIKTGQASSLPFVIVRLGPQTTGQYWGNLGDSIDVWPYAEDQTWQDLDLLCGLVLLRLDKQIVTDANGTEYQLNYGGVSTQDTPVAQWDAYTRPLRFDSIKTTSTTPGASHPLADAMNAWSAVYFPDENIWWQVTASPRVASEADHFNIWMDKMRATVVGHIITSDPKVVVRNLDKLTAILPRATVHYANTYLATLEVTRADPEADPHLDGQVTIDVSYGSANGNFWAGLNPGNPAWPWNPWLPLPGPEESVPSVPLEHIEGRDGVLVGVVPEGESPREPLAGSAHGQTTVSGKITT